MFISSNKRNLIVAAIIAGAAVIAGIIFFVSNNSSISMSNQVAKAGDHVFVHYTGKFSDGKVFDSSLEREPIDFILGAGQVIKGWDTGIAGMKIGERKTLVIPPGDAYGTQAVTASDGTVIIPANSTLTFDVMLVSIEK